MFPTKSALPDVPYRICPIGYALPDMVGVFLNVPYRMCPAKCDTVYDIDPHGSHGIYIYINSWSQYELDGVCVGGGGGRWGEGVKYSICVHSEWEGRGGGEVKERWRRGGGEVPDHEPLHAELQTV